MLYKPIFSLIAAFAGVSSGVASAAPLRRWGDGGYPPPPVPPIPINECDSGQLCCPEYTASNNPNALIVIARLNINMSQISPQAIGLECFPFSDSQPNSCYPSTFVTLCCATVSYIPASNYDFVGIGCTPIES